MGVKDLWFILDTVKTRHSLEELRGQTVAIDLSIWIVEAQSLTQLQHIKKPHLRHVFFRVCHLLNLDIVPLIVVEGIPPDLKQATMQHRQRGAGKWGGGWRGRGKKGSTATGHEDLSQKKMSRTRFNGVHKECCEMLECLGVPWVQSAGEAEAMCAYLNRVKLVDACITNDGDAFLYGARTVYRNFTINTKDPHVDCYNMADVEAGLRLTRCDLVGLALLIGCDYLPSGVPGVGREIAMKLVANLPHGQTILDRFDSWLNGVECYGAEKTVARKATAQPQFPYSQRYAFDKMEWPHEYSFSKLLPLLTKFDMNEIISKRIGLNANSSICMQPDRIVKSRVKHGVASFQVLWTRFEDCLALSDELFMTVEDQIVFSAAYPDMVQRFTADTADRKQGKKKDCNGTKPKNSAKQKKSANVVQMLSSQILNLSLDKPSSPVRDSIHTIYSDPCVTNRLNVLDLDDGGFYQDITHTPRYSHIRRSTSLSNLSGSISILSSAVKPNINGNIHGYICCISSGESDENLDNNNKCNNRDIKCVVNGTFCVRFDMHKDSERGETAAESPETQTSCTGLTCSEENSEESNYSSRDLFDCSKTMSDKIAYNNSYLLESSCQYNEQSPSTTSSYQSMQNDNVCVETKLSELESLDVADSHIRNSEKQVGIVQSSARYKCDTLLGLQRQTKSDNPAPFMDPCRSDTADVRNVSYCLTPLARKDVGNFHIETSLLDNDEEESEWRSNSLFIRGECDTVTTADTSLDGNNFRENECTYDSFAEITYDIQTPCCFANRTRNARPSNNSFARIPYLHDLISTEPVQSASSTPYMPSLVQRLTRRLGGTATNHENNSNGIDALAAMLK